MNEEQKRAIQWMTFKSISKKTRVPALGKQDCAALKRILGLKGIVRRGPMHRVDWKDIGAFAKDNGIQLVDEEVMPPYCLYINFAREILSDRGFRY
jgi:hypothetical protein